MPGIQKHFYERIVRAIRQSHMIAADDHVLVGVSGGIDSIVLLYALYQLRNRLHISVSAAHLNHQFRGAEAARDAEFVRQFCERFAIPCYIESRDVPALIRQTKLSPQDAARQVRYQVFEAVAERINAQKIATAHHADDQAETVLLALIRGAGLHGLGGIQPVVNSRIIRPLITTTREQIETFADAEHLPYMFDSSNASRKYLRNAIRLDLLPMLKQKFQPAIAARLNAYAQTFREDACFIDKIAGEHYLQICERVPQGVRIHLERFRQEEPTLQRAILYKAFDELTGLRHVLETRHVRAVIDLLTQKTPGKRLALPQGIVAIHAHEWGCFQRKSAGVTSNGSGNVERKETAVEIPGTTIFGAYRIDMKLLANPFPGTYAASEPQTSAGWTHYVDYDRLCPPITVRCRRAGDAFHPFGMTGTKRVKKFFIDRKVPQEQRNTIPVLTDKHGLICIIGFTIDDRVKLTEQTEQVLCCQVYQHEEIAAIHGADRGNARMNGGLG